MTIQQHMIGRQKVLFSAPNQWSASSWQDFISTAMRKDFGLELSKRLDAICPPDQVIRINKMQVEISDVTEKNLIDKVVEAVSKEVEKELAALKSTKMVQLEPARANMEVLAYFLQYGTLPWWKKPTTDRHLIKELITELNDQDIQELQKILVRHPAGKERLSWILEPKTILTWTKFSQEVRRDVIASMDTVSSLARKVLIMPAAKVQAYQSAAMLSIWSKPGAFSPWEDFLHQLFRQLPRQQASKIVEPLILHWDASLGNKAPSARSVQGSLDKNEDIHVPQPGEAFLKEILRFANPRKEGQSTEQQARSLDNSIDQAPASITDSEQMQETPIPGSEAQEGEPDQSELQPGSGSLEKEIAKEGILVSLAGIVLLHFQSYHTLG